jgi:SPP1 gp7 family putative phage head morphogenesis protein
VAYKGYVNKDVQAMYGIPYSQLTAEQKRILHEDSKRRAKLIEETQQQVMKNNLKAFEDEAKLEKVLGEIYRDCQKQILANVTETIAKVKKAGGTWSYANQSALTRSRGLFDQITAELNKLGQKEQAVFTQGLGNIYTDQFLRQVYTLGQSITVKANFNRLNPALVKRTLDYPWSGAMFSDRIWLDKETLEKNLRVGLTQSMILGEGIPEITERINKNIGTAQYNAERLARTETKRVTYVAHNDAYEDLGVEQVKYYTSGMKSASEVCGTCKKDNGKIFKRGEEPTLPRHPNCKCVYIPVVEDTFKNGELNDLTGSIRGAENYEKWKADQLAKQKKAEKKEKTPQDLIREDIENEKAKGKAYRDGLNAQVKTKMKERDDIPNSYADELSKIDAEKATIREKQSKLDKELEDLYAERDNIPNERRKLGDLLDEGKISEDEYDKLREELSQKRRDIRDKISELESEHYGLSNKISPIDARARGIQREIQKKQADILDEVRKLNEDIKKSIDMEMDFDMDINFVGDDEDSLFRYNHIKEFRNIRTSHKNNATFDYDTYKDELVKMAQRMDEDALIINSKMGAIIEKNWYNNYNGKKGAHYSSDLQRVHMKMEANEHEQWLGNGLRGSWQTKIHEEGHQIDHLLCKVEKLAGKSLGYWAFTEPSTETGRKFSEAIFNDIIGVLNNAVQEYNTKNSTNFKKVTSLGRISADTRVAFDAYICGITSNGMNRKASCQLGIFTDAIGLYTSDRLSRNTLSCGGWGHSSDYNKAGGKTGSTSETWATFCALRACGSKEEVEFAKNIMPNTWKAMDEVYHNLAEWLKTNDFSY